MLRVRFKANLEDCRPMSWPLKHPYWCTGETDEHSVMVAYVDDITELMRSWPEAVDIEYEKVMGYSFTPRFPRPEWFTS